MAMDKEERTFFERMSKAQKEMSRALEREAATQEEMTRALEQMSRTQERVADAMEKQQSSKVAQILTTTAAIATTIGGLCVVDVIMKWLKGG
jgi:ferric-dicitrate binding protein FerR (iron transport regulator)